MIGPDKKIKLILLYPMTTGRNFDEVLRVVDSLQLTAKHKVATPANWQQGEDVIIAGSVTNDQAKEIYPELEGAQALHPDRAGAQVAQAAVARRSGRAQYERARRVEASASPRPASACRVLVCAQAPPVWEAITSRASATLIGRPSR